MAKQIFLITTVWMCAGETKEIQPRFWICSTRIPASSIKLRIYLLVFKCRGFSILRVLHPTRNNNNCFIIVWNILFSFFFIASSHCCWLKQFIFHSLDNFDVFLFLCAMALCAVATLWAFRCSRYETRKQMRCSNGCLRYRDTREWKKKLLQILLSSSCRHKNVIYFVFNFLSKVGVCALARTRHELVHSFGTKPFLMQFISIGLNRLDGVEFGVCRCISNRRIIIIVSFYYIIALLRIWARFSDEHERTFATNFNYTKFW